MSRADEIFIQNCRDILENGVWDTDREVRPRWEDGSPAHTVKKFGIVNRYDLSKEFPLLTLRRKQRKTEKSPAAEPQERPEREWPEPGLPEPGIS